MERENFQCIILCRFNWRFSCFYYALGLKPYFCSITVPNSCPLSASVSAEQQQRH